ncbi:hypothetical protein HYV83_04075 [Candidatus Woesearchaeota archaeon]|nr:hypothetical protein [Candidatus Woesearchaeota archaeon]
MIEGEVLVETVQVLKSTIKEVRGMFDELGKAVHGEGSNGHRPYRRATKGKVSTSGTAGNEEHGDADFSEFYGRNHVAHPSETKAVEHYQNAIYCMGQIKHLQGVVAYRGRMERSGALQALERARNTFYSATSEGPLKFLHRLAPEPVPLLEALVQEEIDKMVEMQGHVKLAIEHSQIVVRQLQQYDEETVNEFGEAKKAFLSLEQELVTTRADIVTTRGRLSGMDKAEQDYVPLKQQMDSLQRMEKEQVNEQELAAQKVVYTDKQSPLIQRKEDIVRRGLHQLCLVNDYVTGFLTFVQRTRSAEAIIPQLVETAQVVSESYQILSEIFQTGNVATTKSISELVSAIDRVDHKVYPSAQLEVQKQKYALEGVERKTTFTEQASRLLRENTLANAQMQPDNSYNAPTKPQTP